MKRILTRVAMAAAALAIGGAAMADQTLEHFQGTIPFSGGQHAYVVPMNKDTHYEFHMHSKTKGATFSLRLFRGFQLVAEQPANGHEKVEMEYTPVVNGNYVLRVVASAPGEFKGNLKLDDD